MTTEEKRSALLTALRSVRKKSSARTIHELLVVFHKVIYGLSWRDVEEAINEVYEVNI